MGRGDELGLRCVQPNCDSSEFRQCSPHEIFYGETPQSSPIPFLKSGFYKFERTNKIDPKARECFCLGVAINYPRENKRVLVRTGKVMITETLHGPMNPFHVLQP